MIPKQVTLSNLAQSSAQEVFDWIVYNLLRQGRKSHSNDDDGTLMCMYRGDNGTKCAAGWLISDREYTDGFEFKTWDDLVNYNQFPLRHKELIAALQRIHDAHELDTWLSDFTDLAKEKNLNTKYLRKDIS